jgi:hypothetical protein
MPEDCDHDWIEAECVSDTYDPLEPYGHRQSVEIINQCSKCGEVYEYPEE